MYRRLLLTGWLTAIAAAALAELPVTQVVVFRNRAEIERSGEVTLEPGVTAVKLEGLPWQMETDTIRAFVRSAGTNVQRIEITPVHGRLVREEEARELKDKSVALQARIEDLNSRAQQLNEQIRIAERIEIRRMPQTPDEPPHPIEFAAPKWMEVLDFISDSMAGYAAKLEAVREEIEQAEIDLEVLTTQLTRLTSKDVQKFKNATVFIRSARATRTPLHVTYMVDGPQWFPRYEARADVDGGKVQLVAYALVRQQTGEDWLHARVTLSTANLDVSAALPNVPTVRISPAGMLRAEPVVTVGNLRHYQAVQVEAPVSQTQVQGGTWEWVADQGGQAGAEIIAQLGDVQDSLSRQRTLLRSAQQFSSNATLTAQPQQQQRATQQAPVDGKGNRFAQIRDLYTRQKTAFKTAQYDDFNFYNGQIQYLWNTLPKGQKAALSGINEIAISNTDKAQRLLRSRELEKNLDVPMNAVRGLDYRFGSISTANIHSEWVLTKVRFADITIDATFVYESAPILREQFYLIGNGNNPLGKPLLPGPMAVFIGPDFVGETTMPTTGSGKALRFELGADRDVAIARRIRRRRDTRGFILKTYQYDYDVEIDIVNHKDKPIRAMVFDRCPYTDKYSKATVGGFAAEPAPTVSSKTRHQLRWDFDLAAGAAQCIEFGYDLSYRRSMQLQGSEGGQTW